MVQNARLASEAKCKPRGQMFALCIQNHNFLPEIIKSSIENPITLLVLMRSDDLKNIKDKLKFVHVHIRGMIKMFVNYSCIF